MPHIHVDAKQFLIVGAMMVIWHVIVHVGLARHANKPAVQGLVAVMP